MNIKQKILSFTSILVISSVLVILFSVLYILNCGIEQQTKSLLKELRIQSLHRISSSNEILQRLVADYLDYLRHTTKDICNNTTIKEGIAQGQWKSIFGQMEMICKRAHIDFCVVFDENGDVLISWPHKINDLYPERHFKELLLFSRFKRYVDNENLVDVPIFSQLEKWDKKTHKGYNLEIDDNFGMLILSAGIIPNDYFDEPVGYVFSGITSKRLIGPLEDFYQIAGQASVLVDGMIPLVWAGFPGSKNSIKESLTSFRLGKADNFTANNFKSNFIHAGREYLIHATSLNCLTSVTAFVPIDVASAYLISGEPVDKLLETSEVIKKESSKTKNHILFTILLLAVTVFSLTIVVVNFVGNKIAKPIQTAADISQKIASGDLNHFLEEANSDETGRLAKSMNTMIKNLKDLREKNEKQLKALEEGKKRIEKILSSVQEGVILVDTNTKEIIEVNPAAADMINAKPEDIIGTLYHRYICPSKEENHLWDPDKPPVRYTDHFLITTDGKQLPILKTVVTIMLADRKCMLTSFMDITPLKAAQKERQRLELQLQQAKKMEAIGVLAGGVAHDLNNILSGIVSYPDLLLMQLPDKSSLRPHIETIRASGMKAAEIVQDLLTLARRGVVCDEIVNLNDIITAYLYSPEYKKMKLFHPNILVTTDLDEDLLNIMGSPVHLSKTVMNLVSNAAEAMPNGGKVTISTENRYFDGNINGFDDVKSGAYVAFTVSDTGVGISLEDKERIFEPFYTKKVMGKSGTGLGLAVVWGTVKDHKGIIDIESTEGKGAAITISFPGTGKGLDKKKSDLSFDEYMGNGEFILIVDDSKEQREMAITIFSKLGYKATAVSNGERAIEYIKNSAFDLLVLDMILGTENDGLDIYKQILEINPQQKVIIASGFSQTERVKEALKLGVMEYIKKPYTIEKIGTAVKKGLARKAHG
jgi:signal transduction histidine kinase/ActR/RegA family two-component response regulator/HAMP domain-containing protein